MTYERPVLARYYDPCELGWYVSARRLGLTPIVRNPAIFAMTAGSGDVRQRGPFPSRRPAGWAAAPRAGPAA